MHLALWPLRVAERGVQRALKAWHLLLLYPVELFHVHLRGWCLKIVAVLLNLLEVLYIVVQVVAVLREVAEALELLVPKFARRNVLRDVSVALVRVATQNVALARYALVLHPPEVYVLVGGLLLRLRWLQLGLLGHHLLFDLAHRRRRDRLLLVLGQLVPALAGLARVRGARLVLEVSEVAALRLLPRRRLLLNRGEIATLVLRVRLLAAQLLPGLVRCRLTLLNLDILLQILQLEQQQRLKLFCHHIHNVLRLLLLLLRGGGGLLDGILVRVLLRLDGVGVVRAVVKNRFGCLLLRKLLLRLSFHAFGVGGGWLLVPRLGQ